MFFMLHHTSSEYSTSQVHTRTRCYYVFFCPGVCHLHTHATGGRASEIVKRAREGWKPIVRAPVHVPACPRRACERTRRWQTPLSLVSNCLPATTFFSFLSSTTCTPPGQASSQSIHIALYSFPGPSYLSLQSFSLLTPCKPN